MRIDVSLPEKRFKKNLNLTLKNALQCLHELLKNAFISI